MNTEHLQYLLTVERYRSINQAAEALHLQRTYLSKVIHNLEQQFGVTIFERVPKGVVPTTDGAWVLEQVAAVVKILDIIQQRFIPLSENLYADYDGTVVLYCPAKMRYRGIMLKLLEEYQKKFPNVQLILAEKAHTLLAKTITGQNNQMALALHSDDIAHLNWKIPEELRFTWMSDLPVVALVSPKHPLADSYQTISLAMLCKQKLVLMQSDDMEEQPMFYDLLASYGKPDIAHVVNGNPFLFYELLASGKYFTLGLAGTNTANDLLEIPLRESFTVSAGILFDPLALEYLPSKFLAETILKYLGKSVRKNSIRD